MRPLAGRARATYTASIRRLPGQRRKPPRPGCCTARQAAPSTPSSDRAGPPPSRRTGGSPTSSPLGRRRRCCPAARQRRRTPRFDARSPRAGPRPGSSPGLRRRPRTSEPPGRAAAAARACACSPLAAAMHGASRRLGQALGQHLHDYDAFAALNTAFMTRRRVHRDLPGLALRDAHLPGLSRQRPRAAPASRAPWCVAGAEQPGHHRRAAPRRRRDGPRCRMPSPRSCSSPARASTYHTIARTVAAWVCTSATSRSPSRPAASSAAHSLALDGRLVRNDAHVVLGGRGLRLPARRALPGGRRQPHRQPDQHRPPRAQVPSRESYRGVVAGRGQAVWSGRAVVRPGAQGTDARQTQPQPGSLRRRRGPRQAAPRDLRQRRQVLARRHHRPPRPGGPLLPALARHRRAGGAPDAASRPSCARAWARWPTRPCAGSSKRSSRAEPRD